jgi:hypothetical protein
VAHYAQAEIYHSSNSVERGNAMWDFVFDRVRSLIRKKNADQGKMSTLEILSERIKKDYGIKVEMGVRRYKMDAKVMSIIARVNTNAYTVKMGHWDLLNVVGILDRIPKSMVRGIDKIERRVSAEDVYESMIRGVSHKGSYDRRSRTLTLSMDEVDDSDEDIIGHSESSYEYTIAHEVGHAVHHERPEMFKAWCSLSDARKDFPIACRDGSFLTPYASTNKMEDFAETFACYIIFPEEFRQRAKTRPVLMEKYEFMKRLFEGREYDQICTIGIAEIAGPMSYDYALRERIMMEDEKYYAKDKVLSDVIKRIEIEESKNRRKGGPRILPVEAIDDPELAEKELDPRESDEPIRHECFEIRDLLESHLRKSLKGKGRFVDVGFLEMRLGRGDYKIAAMDIANGLGIDEAGGMKIVDECRKVVDRYMSSKRAVDDQS